MHRHESLEAYTGCVSNAMGVLGDVSDAFLMRFQICLLVSELVLLVELFLWVHTLRWCTWMTVLMHSRTVGQKIVTQDLATN